jgi:hypothetical protein
MPGEHLGIPVADGFLVHSMTHVRAVHLLLQLSVTSASLGLDGATVPIHSVAFSKQKPKVHRKSPRIYILTLKMEVSCTSAMSSTLPTSTQ